MNEIFFILNEGSWIIRLLFMAFIIVSFHKFKDESHIKRICDFAMNGFEIMYLFVLRKNITNYNVLCRGL